VCVCGCVCARMCVLGRGGEGCACAHMSVSLGILKKALYNHSTKFLCGFWACDAADMSSCCT
jgi:hypothetical protein